MTKAISIGLTEVGSGHPAFMMAEAGVNHNGSVDMAMDLIRAAKRSGADCVKFQTFRADRVVTASAPKARYQTFTTDPAESQLDMLRKLELDEGAYRDLIALCQDEGIVFMSTPYNEADVDFLDSLDVPAFKAASIHAAEPRFLRYMAETGRCLIVSTGMATWEETDRAVEAIRATGNENFILLQCTTNYPSDVADTNLRAMTAMGERYGCLVGYSDHTQSHLPCIAAAGLGAAAIEKHFTLDRTLPGPDQSTSETPEEFAALVDAVRLVETALGSAEKGPTEAERANMTGMRRSLVARRDIPVGTVISDDDLTCKRPATGIAPKDWDAVTGRTAKRAVAAGAMLAWDDLEQ